MAEIRLIRRGEYDLKRAGRIKLPSGGKAYFALFAGLGTGAATTWLVPSHKMVNFGAKTRITYGIELSKSLLGKIKGATLHITSEVNALPEMILRGQQGSLPVFDHQGDVVIHLPPGSQPGRYEIPAAFCKKNQYPRLTLANRSDYDQFDIELQPGTTQVIG